MQRWGFSEERQERVDAEVAELGCDYLCPECHGTIRVRRGDIRVPHFFHRNEASSCRHQKKDGLHRAVQMWLLNQLGESTCTLECFFPSIVRVADVAYHPAQVVFEVQRSPIDPEEAIARTESYWSIGWHVIWILHVARYGRRSATAFERSLAGIPHYFTDIGFREGRLWDEWSCVRGSRRYWYALPPARRYLESVHVLPLNPIGKKTPVGSVSAKTWIQNRETTWSCHLEGDLLFTQLPESEQKEAAHFLDRLFLYVRLWWLHFLSGS